MKLPQWPYYDKKQIQLAAETLQTGKVNYWTGDQGKIFEAEFAKYSDTKYGIAMANGSLALFSAFKSIGLKSGDEIITTPRTFIATASMAVLLEAKPIFADVDIDSGMITADTIESLITPRTKAIVVVHLGGWPAEMEKICDLANNYKLLVIEDCSQAHGAQIKFNDKFKSVGSFGDLSAWSFCQDKIITTGGEGGMVTTQKEIYWKFIRSFKDHGKDIDEIYSENKKLGFRYIHNTFGFNFRLTEFQSAIGRYQLKLLDEWIALRERNALYIAKELSNLDIIRIPLPTSKFRPAWYRLYGYLNKEVLSNGWTRERILAEINEAGYPGLSGSCSEIYLEKCFKDAGLSIKSPLQNARELGETSLMFLVHPNITLEEVKLYANTIKSILKRATR